jgi:YHS domain-containing protein
MVSFGYTSADEKEATAKKKDAAFCPVGGIGHDINKKFAVDFEGGKVSFCCEMCPAEFKKSPEKFAANARHQLLATHQIEQTACPLSGKPLNKEQKLEVAGVEVTFCCANCKGAVAKAEKEEAKIAMVFKDSLKDSKKFKKVAKKSEKTESKT